MLRRWYSLQVSLIEFLWGRLPVLTWVYFFRDDRTVTWEVSWVRRPAYLSKRGEWVVIPRRGECKLAYRILAGLVVVPNLTYVEGKPVPLDMVGVFDRLQGGS